MARAMLTGPKRIQQTVRAISRERIRPAPANPDAHPLGGGADRSSDVLASEKIRAMHLSRMRPAPELARGQLAAGIGAERTANTANNETRGCHDGITASLARICGTVFTWRLRRRPRSV